MGSALLTCLFSREARECEPNCLHHLGDMLSGPRKCPHCGEAVHQPEPPAAPKAKKPDREGHRKASAQKPT